MDTEMILVTAPNEAGRKFIKLLMYKKMPFAVLTNSAGEERRLRRIGVEHVIRMNTAAGSKMVFAAGQRRQRVYFREQPESDLSLFTDLPFMDIEIPVRHYGAESS